MASFEKHKQEAMKKLASGDKSKKGSIDEGVEGIISILNAHANYYTTSSCAGRIMVIDSPENGKKWDVKWLLNSHKKVGLHDVILSFDKIENTCWVKIDPAILHVACKNIKSAEKLLNLARDQGFRRAGIISMSKIIIVEIIGSQNMQALIGRNGEVIVKESYLQVVIEEANKKLQINGENLARLETALQSL